MTTVKDIYGVAEKFINKFLREESADQGHTLTGAMEDSFDFTSYREGKADVMEGFAVHYTKYVNDGVPAASASMKQFPFVKEFFIKRGLGTDEAGAAAAATIRVWMKEGMSTQASKRFSKTGARQRMVENAFAGNESKLDEFMGNNFDFAVEENFQKEKSETI
jgi:hypothetical protein